MNAQVLKERLKATEDSHDKATVVRIHRAISWLARAELETGDFDAQFLFLWISFNAAYARELGTETVEREKLMDFLDGLLAVDTTKQIYHVLFERYSGPIRMLVENRFVFEPFWRALRDHDASGRWETQFASSKKASFASIMAGDTRRVMSIVFDRLYVLRNQLVHGGATWNSRINRAQVRDGAAIMLSLMPLLIGIMIDHSDLVLGPINYPVIAP